MTSGANRSSWMVVAIPVSPPCLSSPSDRMSGWWSITASGQCPTRDHGGATERWGARTAARGKAGGSRAVGSARRPQATFDVASSGARGRSSDPPAFVRLPPATLHQVPMRRIGSRSCSFSASQLRHLSANHSRRGGSGVEGAPSSTGQNGPMTMTPLVTWESCW